MNNGADRLVLYSKYFPQIFDKYNISATSTCVHGNLGGRVGQAVDLWDTAPNIAGMAASKSVESSAQVLE